MTTYLLDTNTCVEYLRRRNDGIRRRMQSHRPDELRLCSVVVGELYYGTFKSARQAENLRLLAEFVPVFQSLAFDNIAAERYGKIEDAPGGCRDGDRSLRPANRGRSVGPRIDTGDAQRRRTGPRPGPADRRLANVDERKALVQLGSGSIVTRSGSAPRADIRGSEPQERT